MNLQKWPSHNLTFKEKLVKGRWKMKGEVENIEIEL